MRVKQEVDKIKQMFATDRDFKTRLERGDTELFSALDSGNEKQVEKLVTDRLKEVMDKQKKEQERQMKMKNADPNDMEAQKMIEEEIRAQMIRADYETAMENNPEFFGNVTMLYIDTSVNGNPV